MNPIKNIALLSLLALMSCTDEPVEQSIGQDREISFSYSPAPSVGARAAGNATPLTQITLMSDDQTFVDTIQSYFSIGDMELPDAAVSRGVPIDGQTGITGFEAYAYFHPAGGAKPQVFFTEEKVSATGPNQYATANSYFWPDGDGKLSFYALVGASSATTLTPSASGDGNFDIDYTVPTDVARQNDLLLATTEPINTPGTPVPLQFRHLCSQVTFVIGRQMQQGTIKSITLTNIYNKGQYTHTTRGWTVDETSKTNYSIDIDRPTDGSETIGTPIYDKEYTMMLMPQTVADDAEIVVVFTDNLTGSDHILKAGLAIKELEQGRVTKYYIGITPQYQIDLSSPIGELDAHYVIWRPNIVFANVPIGTEFNVRITAVENGGSDTPSVQLTSQENEFVKTGMWTDKLTRSNGTVESARGQATLTATVTATNMPVTVFLPENADRTGAVRKYELEIWLTSDPNNKVVKEIIQLAPAWSGNDGWEQIKENTLFFGFDWDYVVYYGYLYSASQLGNSSYRTFCQNLITSNGADNYATVETYSSGFLRIRYCIKIDYSELNSFGSYTFDDMDGIGNTTKINQYAGLAALRSFETLIQTTMKTETGKEDEVTFRRGNGTTNEAPAPTGNRQPGENNAVSECLKKNKYNLRETRSDNDLVTTPELTEQGIVWYLPAVGQFGNLPATVKEVIVPANCWSSTVVKGADTDGRYYTKAGDGTQIYRMTALDIRAVRK
ncbi:MAG: fimbrillin family protein [Muribaculaceae bacterium]|nr:fimbrillin family protein [Muribaculaceae bacterium]